MSPSADRSADPPRKCAPASACPEPASERSDGTGPDWAEARRLYEETGLSVRQIAGQLGAKDGQIRYRAQKFGWVRHICLTATLKDADGQARSEMISRLYRAFEKQIVQLEARLDALFKSAPAVPGADLGDVDKTARTLASLARTLDTLIALEEARGAKEEPGDDPDALRQELAARLERLPGGGPA